jgi:hypothetical protein
MAFHAGYVLVNGLGDFRYVDVHGDGIRACHFVQIVSLVALEAGHVGYGQGDSLFSRFVRQVTVGASGDSAGFLFPQLTPDYALVHVFDARVTLHARRRYVAPGNRGLRFGVGKDQVTAMAVCARRRYD